MGLKITGIVIDQLGGIEHDEFVPMDINFRAGGNAVGKSSWINALHAAFAGGDFKSLIRKGAAEGSVRIRTSGGYEIVRRFRREREPITEVLLDGTKQRNPQTIINGLLDSFTIDLRKWLTYKDDEKATLIMESMPLSVPEADEEELTVLLPENARAAIKRNVKNNGAHAIQYLGDLRAAVFDMRTDENREVKRLKSSVTALQEAMPKSPPGDKNWGDVLAEAEAESERLIEAKNDRIDKVRTKHMAVISEAEVKRRKAESKAAEAYQAELKKIEDSYSSEREVAMLQRDEVLGKIEAESAAELTAARAAIEAAKANAELEQRAEGLRVNIAENTTQLSATEKTISALERTLNKIDSYRAGLLENAPIPGLEMENGRLALDGVDISQLNTGKLLELSLDLAALRMQEDDLRTVFVDNLECLDKEHQAAFITAVLARNIQAFGGLLAEGPVRTITDPEEWDLVPEEVG